MNTISTESTASTASKNQLISVIVPLYNNERFVSDCIASIVNQTYKHIEVIVVNDGCTDSSIQQLQPFLDKITLINQRNQGSAVARNNGIAAAKGSFIAFNDADDLWTPYKLELQMQYLVAHKDADLVCGIDLRVAEDFAFSNIQIQAKQAPKVNHELSGDQYLTLFSHCPFHINNLVVRKSALAGIAFKPELRRGQDLDFWFQLCKKTDVVYLNEVFSYYRDNQNSISYAFQSRNVKLEIVTNAARDYGLQNRQGNQISTAKLNRILANIHAEYAYSCRLHDSQLKASQSYLHAMLTSPLNMSIYTGLLACLLEALRLKRLPTLNANNNDAKVSHV